MITVTLSPTTRWSNMNGPTQTGLVPKFVAELRQLRRRQDDAVVRRRTSSQRREPVLQVEDDGVRPGRGDAVDRRSRSRASSPGRSIIALDRGDDRLRVERRAVVELDPLAQLDRVGELVLRDHRQRGGELGTICALRRSRRAARRSRVGTSIDRTRLNDGSRLAGSARRGRRERAAVPRPARACGHRQARPWRARGLGPRGAAQRIRATSPPTTAIVQTGDGAEPPPKHGGGPVAGPARITQLWASA